MTVTTAKKTVSDRQNRKINFRADIKKFTQPERENIKAARKILGTDRPTFYHDAVVNYANEINGEKNG